jgi:hypothetical protein
MTEAPCRLLRRTGQVFADERLGWPQWDGIWMIFMCSDLCSLIDLIVWLRDNIVVLCNCKDDSSDAGNYSSETNIGSSEMMDQHSQHLEEHRCCDHHC